jgi:hypothetical protein
MKFLKSLLLISIILVVGFICIRDANAAKAKPVDLDLTPQERAHLAFYVYADFKSPLNHYHPSGWMGDTKDLNINQANTKTVHSGKTSIRVQYTPKGGEKWAGVFWQHPSNNWGDKEGGFDLSKATFLTFWARGEFGNEVISEIKVGGIKGDYDEWGDSGSASRKSIKLTKEWKLYYIDLKKVDTSHIIGGFCFAVNKKQNPRGCVFYIDEIRYEMNR